MSEAVARLAWHKLGKVLVGIMLAVLALLVLFKGTTTLISGLALVGAAVAAYEISRMLKHSNTQGIVMALALVATCLVCYVLLSVSREVVNEFMFLALLGWLIIAPLQLVRSFQLSVRLQSVLWGFFLVSAWLALAILAEYDRGLLIAGLSAVWLADASAWFVGKSFGRKKLAPVISPNKSWEGVYGALICVSLFALLLWWWYLSDTYAQWLVLLSAVAVTGLAVLGDLVESAFKRNAKVKDSGVLLSSHGGILDRIDSWLPVLPLLALLSTLNT